MLIINQDRDKIILTKKSACLYTLPVVADNGKVYEINLYYGNPYKCNTRNNPLLGSFGSALEALHEMQKIEACELPIYYVSGYSPWDIGKKDLETLTREVLSCEMD